MNKMGIKGNILNIVIWFVSMYFVIILFLTVVFLIIIIVGAKPDFLDTELLQRALNKLN